MLSREPWRDEGVAKFDWYPMIRGRLVAVE